MSRETTPAPVKTLTVDSLGVRIYSSPEELARDVAQIAHSTLTERLRLQGSAAVILATGNSQIQFLDALIACGSLDWSRITLFHMDEYLGIDANHPASFRRYMRERVESRIHPKTFHYLAGDALLPLDECDRYTQLLAAQPIDLCCLGIGENGHLAFNDPPVANFHDRHSVKLVQLDRACRQQQVNEGHFPGMSAVPQYAFTLTVPALCAAQRMLCIAPEKRKAQAVHDALRGPISHSCPASWLRNQPHATLFLDNDSAQLL